MNALSFYRIVYAHFLLPEVSCKMFLEKFREEPQIDGS